MMIFRIFYENPKVTNTARSRTLRRLTLLVSLPRLLSLLPLGPQAEDGQHSLLLLVRLRHLLSLRSLGPQAEDGQHSLLLLVSLRHLLSLRSLGPQAEDGQHSLLLLVSRVGHPFFTKERSVLCVLLRSL